MIAVAVYRYQAVAVGWWRGKIKRWNTTFHANTSSYAASIKSMMQAICYPNPGDVLGDCSGGLASITVYNGGGGAPIQQNVYFDWETPSSWVPFLGTAWSSIPETTPLDASGESALVVVGNLPGLSASGKPMSTRKYIHAVPSRSSVEYTDPDVPAAAVTALTAAILLPSMTSPSGVVPQTVTVEEYYGNHQRVRGRRRTVNQVAAQAFSGGVVMGTSACTSGGGGSPAQFQ